MNEEKIIEMLLKHDADIEWLKANVATKKDLAQISETLDKLLEISIGNSQEIKMTHRSIERLDDKVAKHDEAIGQIQRKLGFA